jgi:hypothetical protein
MEFHLNIIISTAGGRFTGLKWMKHVKVKEQIVSHSRVNAHFQNALAEKRIHDLQDSMHTMLMHAKHQCWKAINSHVWPYALPMANNHVHMNTPGGVSGEGSNRVISKIASPTDPKHYHPFGCPVYIHLAWQQADGKGEKWLE